MTDANEEKKLIEAQLADARKLSQSLAESRAYALALEQELRDRAEKAEAERDAAMAGAVKVKPLVWFDVEKSRYGGKYTADGYTIRYIDGLWLLDFAGQSKAIWLFQTIEAAKAAALIRYTARIRAALQPDPEGRQADLAKAFCMGRDAALDAFDKLLYSPQPRPGPQTRHFRGALLPPADLAAKIGGE